MNWLFIGTLLGSIVTSGHDTKEACEGRKAVLQEKGVVGQCHQAQQATTGNLILSPNGSTLGKMCSFGNTVWPC